MTKSRKKGGKEKTKKKEDSIRIQTTIEKLDGEKLT